MSINKKTRYLAGLDTVVRKLALLITTNKRTSHGCAVKHSLEGKAKPYTSKYTRNWRVT